MKNPYQLSAQQARAMTLLSEGKNRKEIALEMGIGVQTAYTHIDRGRQKMKAFSSKQAAERWALWTSSL